MRELATALEAGLPLMQALRTIRRQAAGRAAPMVLDHMIERVEAGGEGVRLERPDVGAHLVGLGDQARGETGGLDVGERAENRRGAGRPTQEQVERHVG